MAKKPEPNRRKLLNGATVKDRAKALQWTFESKCPAKWLHIDCETGELYVRSGRSWEHPSPALKASAMIALKKRRRKH